MPFTKIWPLADCFTEIHLKSTFITYQWDPGTASFFVLRFQGVKQFTIWLLPSDFTQSAWTQCSSQAKLGNACLLPPRCPLYHGYRIKEWAKFNKLTGSGFGYNSATSLTVSRLCDLMLAAHPAVLLDVLHVSNTGYWGEILVGAVGIHWHLPDGSASLWPTSK